MLSDDCCRSKCNEALSEDLWPLDPFESAPMRATSSALCNSIRDANLRLLQIKDLAELPDTKAGSYSLPLKNFPGEFFHRAFFQRIYYLAAMPLGVYATNRDTAIT